MPRRLKLSPMQRDIMFAIEEAGSETTVAVMATVQPADPEIFHAEVSGLIKMGLIRKRNAPEPINEELVITDAGVEALRK